jgi:hypothetical protein
MVRESESSGAITAGLCLAIVVESTVMHLVLVQRAPVVAWVLTASSVSVLVWLLGRAWSRRRRVE